jgi:hypothetical protein
MGLARETGGAPRRTASPPAKREKKHMPHRHVSTLPRQRAKQFLSVFLAVVGCAIVSVPPAQAQTKLKMVLNWKYQGPPGLVLSR